MGPKAAAPETMRSDSQGNANPSSALQFSIILPLVDDRGCGVESLRSWALLQDYPRNGYEIVAVSDGAKADLLAEARRVLAPHDQILVVPGAPLIALYVEGARHARGENLLFSESHCIAAPCAVAAFSRHLAEPALAGVSLESRSRSPNAIARMEGRMFRRHLEPLFVPTHWYKVVLRAFAIRRKAYFAAGEFRPEYGLFAEPALAIALHRRGLRIEFGREPVVEHVNNSRLRRTFYDVMSHARGQCIFRAEAPEAYRRYLGAFREWRHRGGSSVRFARAAWIDCLRGCLTARDWSSLSLAIAGVWRLALPAALGRAAPVIPTGARIGFAALRYLFWFWRRDRRDDALDDLHRRLVDHLRNWCVLTTPPAPPQPLTVGRIGASDLSDEQVFGFHSFERYEEAGLRWAAPVALVPLDLAPGAYRLRLELRGIRPHLKPHDLAVMIDGRCLPREAVAVGEYEVVIEFAVLRRRHATRRLLLLCEPLHKPPSSTDERRLGVAVFSIDITPIAGVPAAMVTNIPTRCTL